MLDKQLGVVHESAVLSACTCDTGCLFKLFTATVTGSIMLGTIHPCRLMLNLRQSKHDLTDTAQCKYSVNSY